MKKLDHKNIIALHNAFVEKKDVIMLIEYCAGGELLEYVQEVKGVEEVTARVIIQQVISAMIYCHNRGIIHRDLKLENVMFKFKDDMVIKVVDFGIAGKCDKKAADSNDAGSIAYMPPEVLNSRNSQADPNYDIWAIGVMLYSLVMNKLPFWGDTPELMTDAICHQKVDFSHGKLITQELKDLILKFMNKNPEQRIPLLEVQNHPWMLISDEDLKERCASLAKIQEEERK